MRRGPGEDRTAVGRAAIECRFAFELALRAWPESPNAADGRARCLLLMFEEAIRQRQAVEAAVLLEEMKSPDVAVTARLRALEAELQRERSAAEAARRAVRESDQRTGARARLAAGGTVLSLGLAVSWTTQGLRLPTHRQTVMLMSVVLALLISVVGLLRRRLLSNLYSRRTVGLLVFLTAMYLAHRVVGWVRDVPVPDVLLGELMIAGVIPGAAVVLGYRNLLGGVLISFVGVAAALVWPQHIALIHPLALVGAQIVYLAVGVEQDQGMSDPFRP